MSELRLDHYAALALDRSVSLKVWSEVLQLVAAAALGFQVPAVIAAVSEFVGPSGGWLSTTSENVVEAIGAYFGSLARVFLAVSPIILAAIGIGLRSRADAFLLAHRLYAAAAKREPQPRPQGGLLAWILGR